MASRWVPSLMALKIKAARRSPRTPEEIRQLIREMSVANPLGGAPASTVNSLSSAWMSARPPWRSTWRKDDGRRRRAGGPLFTITPRPSRRSTCSWCRRSRLGFCTPLAYHQCIKSTFGPRHRRMESGAAAFLTGAVAVSRAGNTAGLLKAEPLSVGVRRDGAT
jgi:hypothetical protein